MTKINSTHVFLSGGITIPSHPPGSDWGRESYIYSKATGFVQIANMSRGRHDHACAVHDEKFVIVEGGSSTYQTEILNLETLTWSDGPYRYFGNSIWEHNMVSKGKSTYLLAEPKIWKLVAAENGSEISWEWVIVDNVPDIEGRGSNVFFMKTQDCQNWNVDTNDF